MQAIHFCFHTDRDPCFPCQSSVLSLDENALGELYEIKVFLTGGENYRSKILEKFTLHLNNFKKFYTPSYNFFMIKKAICETRAPDENEENIKLFTRKEFLKRQEEQL